MGKCVPGTVPLVFAFSVVTIPVCCRPDGITVHSFAVCLQCFATLASCLSFRCKACGHKFPIIRLNRRGAGVNQTHSNNSVAESNVESYACKFM